MGFPVRAARRSPRKNTMNTKSVFLSKTFWVQVVGLLSLAVPQVREWLDKNPEQFVAVFAAVNVLVRFATSGKINIFGAGETPDDKTRGSGPGGLAPLIVMGAAAGLIASALPSCGLPVRATVILPEGAVSYSAKDGLELQVDRRSYK